MKTIEFKSNYGNFAYRMTAEVGDEVNTATTALCLQGLANIAYRIAGSSVDKALGVKERKGVEYSEQTGEDINTAVSKKLTEMLAKDASLSGLKLSFAVTGQHVFGESAPGATKEAKELWVAVQAMPEDRFKAACAKLGIPEDYDDEVGIAKCHAYLRAEKEAAKVAALNKLK